MSAKKVNSSIPSPLVLILFLFAVILVIAGTYLYMQREKTEKTTQITQSAVQPTATPTPRAIPHGKIGFSVGGSKPNAPTFGRGFLDPYDPAKGTKQIISIELSDKVGVHTVTGTVITDHAQQPITFALVEGTEQKGRWEATYVMQDSYSYIYNLKIMAKNTNSTDQVDITLR